MTTIGSASRTHALAILFALGATTCSRRAPPPAPDVPASANAETTAPSEIAAAAPSEIASAAPSEIASAAPSEGVDPIAAPAPRPIARCDGTPPPLPAPPLRAACDPSAKTERITLLHVSDVHAHWHPYLGRRSPFAILRAFAERRRRETGGRVLFVDAGDDLEKGTIAEIRSQGDATVHLLEHLGLDVRTLGNHDFAWGEGSVLAQAASKTHVVLASNVGWAGGEPFAARRTHVVEIGCAKIGLFGLLTNPYDETDERVDAPYGSFAHEHDPGDPNRYVGVAASLVRELRDRGVDAIVGIDHLGLSRDRAIVDAVPGVDLVISGHDHVALGGVAFGRFGAIVSTGSYLGGRGEARVGETVLEIGRASDGTGSVRVVSSQTLRLDDLDDLDEDVQREVERVTSCFAPDAELPIADLAGPLSSGAPDGWTPVLDAALRARFPDAHAFLYEAWSFSGVVKGDLASGPVTPQQLADFAFSERQKVGGPGFTAFEPIDVSAASLRAICAAPLRDGGALARMHRVCPDEIAETGSYRLVIERRPLWAPSLAFAVVPEGFPSPPADEQAAVEAFELLVDHARARGKACRALDRDAPAPCR